MSPPRTIARPHKGRQRSRRRPRRCPQISQISRFQSIGGKGARGKLGSNIAQAARFGEGVHPGQSRARRKGTNEAGADPSAARRSAKSAASNRSGAREPGGSSVRIWSRRHASRRVPPRTIARPHKRRQRGRRRPLHRPQISQIGRFQSIRGQRDPVGAPREYRPVSKARGPSVAEKMERFPVRSRRSRPSFVCRWKRVVAMVAPVVVFVAVTPASPGQCRRRCSHPRPQRPSPSPS